MPDTADKSQLELDRLEEEVAMLDAMVGTMDHEFDVKLQSLKGDIKLVLDAVAALADDMRRTTSSIRSEHAADREIFRMALRNARRF